MDDFAGRLVMVVGATGALGAALCRVFDDAEVVGLDRAEPHEPVAGVAYRTVDVLDDRALGSCFDALPVPWAVVNVVGGFAGHQPLVEFDPVEFDTQVRLNLASAALLTKHALRRMAEVGEGRIVHTASRAAVDTGGSGFAYSVSKAGVLHLVEMAARETHGTAITVNAIVPSLMDTAANRAAMPGADVTRWPKVDEIAGVYRFLTSSAAAVVSGAAVPVYGLA